MLRSLLLACLLAAPLVHADELVSSAAGGREVGLTIYHADLALVRDIRKVTLPAGESQLALTGISSQIQPETALLASDRPLEVLSQFYRFDALSGDALLERSIGREIEAVRVNPATGEERREKAVLLSIRDGQAVFRIGDRIESDGALSPWRLVLPASPELRTEPTLVSQVHSSSGGDHLVELSYLSRGFSWEADYVLRLSPGEDGMDLLAWATIHNATATVFDKARLSLVAGEVNRLGGMNAGALAGSAADAGDGSDGRGADMPAVSAVAPEDRQFEYQIYKLDRPITLPARQSIHVPLFAISRAPVRKLYRINAPLALFGASPGVLDLRVQTALAFANTAPGLGRPLPSGAVRVYQREPGGSGQFLGEARIPPVAEGDEAVIEVGASLDLGARRRQTDYRRLPREEQEAAWAIEFHSTKSEPATVEVTQPFTGQWRIVEESFPHRRDSTDMAHWEVPVPANGRVTLSYRVRSR